MTTDNRTNEQIVAEALREGVHVAGGGKSHLAAADVTYALGKAGRLAAAQGAAPQAEAYDHCCQHPKCPGGSLCCCTSEQRQRDCWNQWREEIAGDSRQAFRDGYQAGQNDPAPWLTAPVLPSSGVDENKLAEVRREAAARALEDAADDHDQSLGGETYGGAWLRARAEAYKEGKLT